MWAIYNSVDVPPYKSDRGGRRTFLGVTTPGLVTTKGVKNDHIVILIPFRVPLRVFRSEKYAYRNNVWYLLVFPFKISDDHPRQHPQRPRSS